MSDPRLDLQTNLAGVEQYVLAAVVDLNDAKGARQRQLLRGAGVKAYDVNGDTTLVQDESGYVGWVATSYLGAAQEQTHRVGTLATHAYTAEDFKSEPVMHLPFGARLRVLDERRKFFETDVGFVPKSHLRPLDRPFEDPATIAQLHFGVPYLWGGNSTLGLDCSGLITASLNACGIACPGDSDMQQEALGYDVTGDHRRGDIIFWDGHVGMMVDDETLIHANAHHMATRYEPIANAIIRIEAQGDGPVTARKRL